MYSMKTEYVTTEKSEYEKLLILAKSVPVLMADNAQFKAENKLLRDKVDLLIKRVFGTSSEKIDPDQLLLDLGEDFIFIAVENDNLIIKYFQEKILTFCRVKRLIAQPEQVFQEVNRSIVGLREQFSNLRRSTVFAHIEPMDTDAYVTGLRTVFEREITLLDPKIDRLTPAGTHFDRAHATRLITAIGTAERLM